MNESWLHFRTLEFAQTFGERFERTVHVGLDNKVQRGNFTSLNLGEDVFQTHSTLHTSIAALAESAITHFTRLAHCASRFFIWSTTEFVASIWRNRQTKYLHWR